MKKRLLQCALVAVGLLVMFQITTTDVNSGVPGSLKEHAWLQQFAGEWESSEEIPGSGPGEKNQKVTGSESGRMIGSLWVLLEKKGLAQGSPYTGILTLGFDDAKKQYVGTWIDSTSSYLWRYSGSLDPSGKTLTMETEGPPEKAQGELTHFKDVYEIQDRDHRKLTTFCEKDGTWISIIVIQYHRKQTR